MNPRFFLRNIILMSYDSTHPWWFKPPYQCVIDRNIKVSHTIIHNVNNIKMYLKRRYDMIHELIHIFMFLADFDDYQDEQIANLSELLEINSLECFPDIALDYFF